MQIEKFSNEDQSGYKIIGATFASSRNTNGAYFDPVEVFSLDNPPEKFNFGHKDYNTDYSTGTKIISNPVGTIEGKMLRFTWDLETTNENFVALIESENFGGFSPELFPKNKPYKSEVGERFYRSGDLQWLDTAILAKDQKPGFVGANEYELEKFEAFEDVVIKQLEDELPETTPTPEVKEDKPTENFKSDELKTAIKEALAEYFNEKEAEGKDEPATGIKEEIIQPEPTEEDKLEQEKFEKMKLEAEHFKSIANAKSKIDDTRLAPLGVESSVGSDLDKDGYKTKSIINNII